jgi:hypothetical protein
MNTYLKNNKIKKKKKKKKERRKERKKRPGHGKVLSSNSSVTTTKKYWQWGKVGSIDAPVPYRICFYRTLFCYIICSSTKYLFKSVFWDFYDSGVLES